MTRVTARLADTVNELHGRLVDDPTAGIVRPQVHTELVEDVIATSSFTQYGHDFEFRCDESEARGGTGSAPSPLRYLLSSIAFCLQVWTAKAASLRGVAVGSCDVDVETFMDMRGEHLIDDVPPLPQFFVVDVVLTGELDGATATAIVLDAMNRCPVSSLIRQAVPVGIRVHLGQELVHDTSGTLGSATTDETTRRTP